MGEKQKWKQKTKNTELENEEGGVNLKRGKCEGGAK